MSFFKKLRRGVKKVVGGVTKAVKGVGNVVKKVVKSPIGRIALMAAATYFGVPMISGALGGASAGFAAGQGFLGTIGSTVSGALSGGAAGLSSAWSGLTGAMSALTTGQGLGAAAKSLSGGFSPSAAWSAGAGTVAPAAAGAPALTNAAQIGRAVGDDYYGASMSGGAAPAASGTGSGGRVFGNWLGSPLGDALIKAGGSMLESYGEAKIAQEMADEAYRRRQEEIEREVARRNANMGRIFPEVTGSPAYYTQHSSYVDRFQPPALPAGGR